MSPSPPISPSPERAAFYTPPQPYLSASSREASPPKRFTAPPPQFSKPLKDMRVREGERATLECWINPFPEPERVEWFKNQVEITKSPDYEIRYKNGVCTLLIAEVFPEDTGTFTCTVTVSGMANSTTMYLTVEGITTMYTSY